MEESVNFRIKKIINCGGIIKLPNATNRYVLASKFRPVKTFIGEKCYFTGQKVIAQPPSVTGGAKFYDKHPTLTTSVW